MKSAIRNPQSATPWSFYQGQAPYLARVGVRDGALVAADTGVGKSMFTAVLMRLKLETEWKVESQDELRVEAAADAHAPLNTQHTSPLNPLFRQFAGRALIVAPQGTTRMPVGEFEDEEEPDCAPNALASQWRQELARFAPDVPVHDLFCWEDYAALVKRYGSLPSGIYLSYYEAFFKNGARECLPDSWDHEKLCKAYGYNPGPKTRTFVLARDYKDKCDLVKEEELLAGGLTQTEVDGLKEGQRLLGGGGQSTVRWAVDPAGNYVVQKIVSEYVNDWTENVGEVKPEDGGRRTDLPAPSGARQAGDRGQKAEGGTGIRCIVEPCLATRIEADHWRREGNEDRGSRMAPACRVGAGRDGPACATADRPQSASPSSVLRSPFSGSVWDFIALDEAHIAANLGSQITRAIIRLQPRYRFAFTATPIPNIVSNLFAIAGWICVPDWFKGGRCNVMFPFAAHEQGRFESMFLTVERDYTQEQMNEDANPKWRGKVTKTSPVIAQPARLLKLLKPFMAYIGKPDCNPNVVPCSVVDVRVPLGRQQIGLYTHFMNRANIPCNNALVRARKQLAYLRGICADPAGFEHGGPRVYSNFSPKTVAVMELAGRILARGEQVVIVASRTGQNDTYERLLAEAIGRDKIARIDSTQSASHHAGQADKFKRGHARVLLMGIKCAKAYSFDNCSNLIVASLEYSYGSLHQAKGRVWRVNSKRPVTVYCVLHKGTIEEVMFDVVATKQDAATICLHGQRIPREFKPLDLTEVLADHLTTLPVQERDERECEREWPRLRTVIEGLTVIPPWKLQVMARLAQAVEQGRGC